MGLVTSYTRNDRLRRTGLGWVKTEPFAILAIQGTTVWRGESKLNAKFNQLSSLKIA